MILKKENRELKKNMNILKENNLKIGIAIPEYLDKKIKQVFIFIFDLLIIFFLFFFFFFIITIFYFYYFFLFSYLEVVENILFGKKLFSF
jgi:hypothetical protein